MTVSLGAASRLYFYIAGNQVCTLVEPNRYCSASIPVDSIMILDASLAFMVGFRR